MTTENRRHFSRIPMDASLRLVCDEQEWSSHLLDISLQGALLASPDGYAHQVDRHCTLRITLGENGNEITMEGKIVHQHAHHLGFLCEHIDLESAGRLRRMIELNLGDDASLARELQELVNSHDG